MKCWSRNGIQLIPSRLIRCELMLIKRISCKVKEGHQDLFYDCQKQWGTLSQVKGFIGQLGGWSDHKQSTACIYAFWESQQDYQYFMDEIHDQIFAASGQGNTYTSIEIDFFQEELRITGLENQFADVIRNAQYIYSIIQQAEKHGWSAGLQKAKGMLGGTFASSQKDRDTFLVWLAWQSEKQQRRTLPQGGAVEWADKKFSVIEAWRVCPSIIDRD